MVAEYSVIESVVRKAAIEATLWLFVLSLVVFQLMNILNVIIKPLAVPVLQDSLPMVLEAEHYYLC